jgi:hypothetical protein
MLQAMRARPSEFEMQGSYLRHKPSHHLVNFDIWGNARVHARCDCAMLDVTRDQSQELKEAIAAWKIIYWEPRLAQLAAARRAAEINREFASHFRPPGLWRRFFALFRSDEPHYALGTDALETITPIRGTTPPQSGAPRTRELTLG